MARYQDGMGHVYSVTPDQIEAFEARRGVLLRLAILIKLLILAILLYYLA